MLIQGLSGPLTAILPDARRLHRVCEPVYSDDASEWPL